MVQEAQQELAPKEVLVASSCRSLLPGGKTDASSVRAFLELETTGSRDFHEQLDTDAMAALWCRFLVKQSTGYPRSARSARDDWADAETRWRLPAVSVNTEVSMIRRMSLVAGSFALLHFILSVDPASSQGFDSEYADLRGGFSRALSNEAAVEALVDKAGDLYDRIRQHRRDNRDSLSDEERDRLRDLAGEVRAFEAVSRVVGQIHNAADVDIESFDEVKDKLGLRPEVLMTHDSGVELVRVEVGSFISWLLRNPTATTFSITYTVNDPERPGGVGSAFCESYSVMSGLFNSRDRDLEGLEITYETRPSRAGSCD